MKLPGESVKLKVQYIRRARAYRAKIRQKEINNHEKVNEPRAGTVHGTGHECVCFAEGTNYAKIGDTEYATLADAVAAVADGETATIEVMGSHTGNGIKIKATKNITINFNGYTYTTNSAVGSTGTESQGFQLLKGNSITMNNGTIKNSCEDVQVLIMNYCNLTLNGMTLDGSDLTGVKYVMSNNCGNTVISDSVLNAPEDGMAFDVWYGNSYPEGVSVTVNNSTINGDIDYSAGSNYNDEQLEDNAKLTINNTVMNGVVSTTSGLDLESTEGISVTPGANQTVVKNDDGSISIVTKAPVVEEPIIVEKEETYKTVIESTENGSVKADSKKVTRGEKVTLTVTPDKGYELAALLVIDEDGNERKVTENEDGIFSFRMPEGGVTVEAEFVKIGAVETAPSTEKENPSTGAADFVGAAAALAVVSVMGMAALSLKK